MFIGSWDGHLQNLSDVRRIEFSENMKQRIAVRGSGQGLPASRSNGRRGTLWLCQVQSVYVWLARTVSQDVKIHRVALTLGEDRRYPGDRETDARRIYRYYFRNSRARFPSLDPNALYAPLAPYVSKWPWIRTRGGNFAGIDANSDE